MLSFGDLWALEGGFGEWITDYGNFLDLLLECGDEVVIACLLDEDTGCGGANLSLVGHDA